MRVDVYSTNLAEGGVTERLQLPGGTAVVMECRAGGLSVLFSTTLSYAEFLAWVIEWRGLDAIDHVYVMRSGGELLENQGAFYYVQAAVETPDKAEVPDFVRIGFGTAGAYTWQGRGIDDDQHAYVGVAQTTLKEADLSRSLAVGTPEVVKAKEFVAECLRRVLEGMASQA